MWVWGVALEAHAWSLTCVRLPLPLTDIALHLFLCPESLLSSGGPLAHMGVVLGTLTESY